MASTSANIVDAEWRLIGGSGKFDYVMASMKWLQIVSSIVVVLSSISILLFYIIKNDEEGLLTLPNIVQTSSHQNRHFNQVNDSSAHFCLNKLPENVINSVSKFIFFVGYARSGHSIIGSILDAHPNVIISHEYSILHKWLTMSEQQKNKRYLYNAIYNNSCYNSNKGLRRSSAMKKGYSLHVNGLWQGAYSDSITVIGDKSGGKTTNVYKSHHKKILYIYKEIVQKLNVPVIAIHVVRNPYDNIATMLLYKRKIKKSQLSIDRPYSDTAGLESHIKSYFKKVQTVVELIQKLQLNVTEIHNEDLIANPRSTLKRICIKLELNCSEEYINKSAKVVFKDISRSRNLIKWTPKLRDLVSKESKNYPFLRRYSFFD